MQRSVVKIAEALPGQDDNVEIPQLRAVRSEGLTGDTFDLVSVNRTPDTFLGNDQAQPRVLAGIGSSK